MKVYQIEDEWSTSLENIEGKKEEWQDERNKTVCILSLE
jgi:hypothetical protein